MYAFRVLAYLFAFAIVCAYAAPVDIEARSSDNAVPLPNAKLVETFARSEAPESRDGASTRHDRILPREKEARVINVEEVAREADPTCR
ncbi:hypothetical protein FISHEDRAFT_77415 [Fistulina hepatica ATCC 64428]|uniref:Uncharacterized protein n=1 Tax=Fistulina hepatica ATCC 64428 TaxID=1128425 RepID=A0A0D7A119_9AGAR|nr:hypothetical protein FISHEDRAFT_77415 [Fistulina hepatica ATCC 64428]